MTFQLK